MMSQSAHEELVAPLPFSESDMNTIQSFRVRVSVFVVIATVVNATAFAQSESASDAATRVTVETPEVEVVIVEKEQAGPPRILDDEGRMVNFQRDISPILVAKCLDCHGPEEAKNDFRVDDVDAVMGYIEAEDVESSSLFSDYLTTEDTDMLMPPVSHGGPLTPGELALIRVWISEGAVWPEGTPLVASQVVASAPTSQARVRSLPERVWAFQGYLHPAIVHFPVALLTVGALFVVLGWKWPILGTQIPLACLVLGSLSTIVATAMGWSFATEQGYAGWDRIDFDSEIFWHRWSGIILTLLSVALMVAAAISVWKDSPGWTRVWKGGLLVAAVIVGLVGHQGGELSYGKDFYPKAFRVLLGNEGSVTPTVAVEVEAGDTVVLEADGAVEVEIDESASATQ